MSNEAKTQLDSANSDQCLASRKCQPRKAMGIQGRILPKLVRFFTGDGLTNHGKWEVHVPSDQPEAVRSSWALTMLQSTEGNCGTLVINLFFLILIVSWQNISLCRLLFPVISVWDWSGHVCEYCTSGKPNHIYSL